MFDVAKPLHNNLDSGMNSAEARAPQFSEQELRKTVTQIEGYLLCCLDLGHQLRNRDPLKRIGHWMPTTLRS